MGVSLKFLLAVTNFGLGVWLCIHHCLSPAIALMEFLALASVALASDTLWLMLLAPLFAVGSLYPWTGELVFAEYDIGLCALLGGRLLSGDWIRKKLEFSKGTEVSQLPSRPPAFASPGYLWNFATIVVTVASLRGWLALPSAFAGDQFSLYTTRSNVFQQSKVILYSMALVPLLLGLLQHETKELRALAWSRLQVGFFLSALCVATVVFCERFITVGLWDWDQELRSAGPCMTMHIGDQHIDAFWTLALPFLLPERWRFRPLTILSCLLMAVVGYSIFATMSRATIFSAVLVVAVQLISQATFFRAHISDGEQSNRGTREFTRSSGVIGACVGLVGLALLALGLWYSGEAVPKRFATIAEGMQARISHWKTVLHIASRTQSQLWLGSGLGTYPIVYRKYAGLSEQPIGLVQPTDMQRPALRLVAGEKIYAAQLVSAAAPLPWRLDVKLRKSSAACGLQVSLCHQVLLQSYDCVVPASKATLDFFESEFQPMSFELTELPNDVAEVEDKWRRAWSPTALSLSAAGEAGDLVEVCNIRVTDSLGNSVLVNSDFAEGSRHWFFVSDDHLSWRAKNGWLHILVETGLLGLGVALTLTATLLSRCLYCAIRRRAWPALVVFTSLAGFLAIGMFGTLIDAPWISLLTIMQLAIAQGLAKEGST